MPNLMQRGAAWLGESQKLASGRTVRVHRDDIETADITAWQDRKTYDADGDDGLETSFTLDVWTFTKSDLVLAGEAFLPRPGDTIVEELDGETVTYEVMPTPNHPGTGWFDTSGILVLVHAKRVD